MAQTVQTREPATVVAGDTVAWRKTLADFPASEGWVLKYRLINSAGKIDITASADGADHAISVPAATTATWSPGTYTWQSRVEKGVERYSVEQGSITIGADLAAQAAGYDTRSTAKKTLDLIDAALIAHGSTAWTQEYEIAGRKMKFKNVSDFLALRDRLRAEVARETATERMRSGLGSKTKILVRF